ncbi:MAG: cytochrome d ubiquinol oxidase subunit II [Bacteroidota bacterium]|nr:cytochrome d ubiquinol oxidase subunit II [Bacteroidota bacterium]
MFEKLSYFQLQEYWWGIASLLGGILAFLMFVQGGQTLIFSAKNETEKSLMINSLGRKWKFTFTTLVTFGGTMFAAFPLFYATSFGGAYWLWFLLLFCFIIQAIAFEFRIKTGNFLGHKTYEMFLFINGCAGTILLGIIVGTFFTGSAFIRNEYNISSWQNPLKGIEALFNIFNISLGLSLFFLARILGALYFINNIKDESLIPKIIKLLKYNSVFFLIFFIYFIIQLLLKEGFAYESKTGIVYLEKYKYLNNILQMPCLMILLISGIIMVLTGIIISLLKSSTKGIWYSGSGTILTVFTLILCTGLNNTCFYPSLINLQSSLTIQNASSSRFTLITMSYVSLFLPIVFAYIFYTWKLIDKNKIVADEIKTEEHVY